MVLEAERDADGAEHGEGVPCPLDGHLAAGDGVGDPSNLLRDGLLALEDIERNGLALELAAGDARDSCSGGGGNGLGTTEGEPAGGLDGEEEG